MQQDIRNLLKNYTDKEVDLSKHHTLKFEKLLQSELHQHKTKKWNYKWMLAAASIILLIGIGSKFYPKQSTKSPVQLPTTTITLGSISPEFQTIETYYKSSINLEISQLELSDENKEIIDTYLIKIKELTKEYSLLTQELNKNGVNDATIDALISNLQLRLQLLQRLKKQLKQLKKLNKTQNDTQVI